jgi:hypothetical protein
MGNQKMKKIIPILLLVILPSCSALILSVGDNETEILFQGATMKTISQHFGPPVEKIKLVPPQPVSIRLVPPENSIGYSSTQTQLLTREISTINALYFCTYKYKGRIERKYDKGQVFSLAIMTLGINELFAVPYSLKEQTQRPDRTHKISVWYDNDENAVAYRWVEIRPEEDS